MPRKPKSAPTEVFISHSSKNFAFISQLNGVLTEHKVKSFVSKTNIHGAQQWHDEIATALKRCDWFLLVLSPQSVRSTWVKHEPVYALQGAATGDESTRSFTSSAIKTRCRGPFRQSNGLISAVIFMKHASSCFGSGSWNTSLNSRLAFEINREGIRIQPFYRMGEADG
jgi:hypothetical protein